MGATTWKTPCQRDYAPGTGRPPVACRTRSGRGGDLSLLCQHAGSTAVSDYRAVPRGHAGILLSGNYKRSERLGVATSTHVRTTSSANVSHPSLTSFGTRSDQLSPRGLEWSHFPPLKR